MRISFISKVARVQEALKVANNTNLCSTILVVFLEFIPVNRAEISHMNTPQNSSRLPGCYEEALDSRARLFKKKKKSSRYPASKNTFIKYPLK